MVVPYQEIDESQAKFAIENITDESMAHLFAKHYSIYVDYSTFWKPRLEIAKKCHNYMRRDIFTPGQRKRYMDVDGKWPIEPQEMKPVINALTGMIRDRIRSGTVTMEDDTPPDNAADPTVVDVVLKHLENKLDLKQLRERALHEGLIDGYPQWLWVNRCQDAQGGSYHYEATLEPWAATLCSKHFLRPDGKDITDVIRIRKMSKGELLDAYPHRRGALAQFQSVMRNDPGFLLNALNLENVTDGDYRRNMLYDIAVQNTCAEDDRGMYTVYEHTYSIKKKRTVWLAPDLEPVVLPDSWEDIKKMQWEEQHPEYTKLHTDVVATLWQTVFGSNGFIWDNGEHWFQKPHRRKPYAKLPGVCFIASMEDNIPTGAGEDMLPYVLLIAACATEGLHQARTGTGQTFFYEEGTVRHPKYLSKERSKASGAVAMKKGSIAGKTFHLENRQPNDTYFNLEDRYRNELTNVHNVNESMRGLFAARQSAVAKDKEIAQGMAVQSEYINNYLNFTLSVTQLIVDMFPFLLGKNEIVQIDDEFGNHKTAQVNVEVADYEGTALNILNDITATAYRIIPAIGDDSPTSREQDLKNFVQIMEAIGNSIFKLMEISPRMVAGFLASWQNRYAKETAKFLLEHAQMVEQQQQQQGQAEMEMDAQKAQMKYEVDMAKIAAPNINYKISPSDFGETSQEAMMGWQIMMQYAQNKQNGPAVSNPQGGTPSPREAPPAAGPQPEMVPQAGAAPAPQPTLGG